MNTWALQDAKARLSEVVRLALDREPQAITLRGEPAVVVLSQTAYEKLSGQSESLVDFMRRSPLHGAKDITLERDRSLTRDVAL